MQTESLPQKASRLLAMSSLSKSSSQACTSTGTSRPESCMASATADSSPKFGRTTMMPLMSSLFLENSRAQVSASSCVWTAPIRQLSSSTLMQP